MLRRTRRPRARTGRGASGDQPTPQRHGEPLPEMRATQLTPEEFYDQFSARPDVQEILRQLSNQ